MKRIGLYLGFPPQGGGAFQYAASLLVALRALPTADYRAVVAHAHPAWAERLQRDSIGIESHAVAPDRRDTAIRLLLRLGMPARTWRRALASRIGGVERQLTRLGCDIWIFPAQDYLAYSMPGPTIGTIHDLMHRYEPSFPEVSALGLYSRRERHYLNTCRNATAILVDSQTGKQHVLDAYGIADDRIHILPYVAPPYIHQRDAPLGFDERYRLPTQYLFYPAQFWQHKNHVNLIRALAVAKKKLPALSLVLVGSPKNNSKAMKEEVYGLGMSSAVTILGYVPDDDMAELYRRSQGLIMPTFFGPTNIPPLEAMATGTPMALSDIYAMREQSREAAIYFDPASVDAIAAAMIKLVEDVSTRGRLLANGTARSAELSQSAFNDRFASILRAAMPP
ncbi:glycosyltransferase family 1 protein [Pseudoxanthomonas sp. USHLN014]|uniref:glycosyltransferase family 4 protein n=1 Tax=Pseudoxanthomonas sp. USHLN014 TaxID=3081297 RepID=UPI00301C28C0